MNESNMKELLLKKYKLRTELAIAHQNIKASSYLHMSMDAMIVSLDAMIAGEQLTKIYKIFPTDWKEALKDRFLPEFFRKWVPVKYEIIDIEVAALYPKYVLPQSQFGPVKIKVMDQSRPYYQYRNEED